MFSFIGPSSDVRENGVVPDDRARLAEARCRRTPRHGVVGPGEGKPRGAAHVGVASSPEAGPARDAGSTGRLAVRLADVHDLDRREVSAPSGAADRQQPPSDWNQAVHVARVVEGLYRFPRASVLGEAVHPAVGLTDEDPVPVARRGRSETQHAAHGQVRALRPRAGRGVEDVDRGHRSGLPGQTPQRVDAPPAGTGGQRAPDEGGRDLTPRGAAVQVEGENRVGPDRVLAGTAHLPAADDVEDPAGHHRVVGRAPHRHVGQRLPPIRGRGVPRGGPAGMQHRGLGDGGVGGAEAANSIDGGAVRNQDRALEAGAARQLFPRRADVENQPPEPGADVLEGVGMDPADMGPRRRRVLRRGRRRRSWRRHRSDWADATRRGCRPARPRGGTWQAATRGRG